MAVKRSDESDLQRDALNVTRIRARHNKPIKFHGDPLCHWLKSLKIGAEYLTCQPNSEVSPHKWITLIRHIPRNLTQEQGTLFGGRQKEEYQINLYVIRTQKPIESLERYFAESLIGMQSIFF